MKTNLNVTTDNFNAVTHSLWVSSNNGWQIQGNFLLSMSPDKSSKENKPIVTFHVDYSIVLSIWKTAIKSYNPTEILEIPVSLFSTNSPQWWLAASHNHALESLYQGKDLRGLPGGEIMFHRDYSLMVALPFKAIKKNLRAPDWHKLI